MRQIDQQSIQSMSVRVEAGQFTAGVRTLDDCVGRVARSNPADDLGDVALVFCLDYAEELLVDRQLVVRLFVSSPRGLGRGFAALGLILTVEVAIQAGHARTAYIAL
jgi:hypothetical protein